MLNVTPQGPGFFIFFQTKIDHNSWVSEPARDKDREEYELMVLLTAMYEAGQFN